MPVANISTGRLTVARRGPAGKNVSSHGAVQYRDEHPGCRADDRQQQALGQPLADQPNAAGAKRTPDRHLVASRRGTTQEQRRNVRAGNEQHEADGREQ